MQKQFFASKENFLTTKKTCDTTEKLFDKPHDYASFEEKIILEHLVYKGNPMQLLQKNKIGTVTFHAKEKLPAITCDLYFAVYNKYDTIFCRYELINNQTTIGYVEQTYSVHSSDIANIFVLQNQSERCIGSYLLVKASDLAQTLGCIWIGGETNATGYRSLEYLIKWYKKRGFISYDDIQGELEDSKVMIKPLLHLNVPQEAYDTMNGAEKVTQAAKKYYGSVIEES